MILTDEEIIDLFPDQDNGDGDIQYGRAIEAAVLAKLNSAEPVAIVTDYTQGSYQRKYTIAWKNEVGVNARLYLHPPAPSAPEGWRCPVCNTDLKAEHAYDCLAAARSENSAISQKEEA